MLHEILMGLLGHDGGLFEATNNGIKVVKDIPFLSPSESAHLNQLCNIIFKYKRFVSFISFHGDKLSYESDSTGLHGLYLKAFCQGLNDVLQPYRLAVTNLEHDILSDPNLSLCHVHSELNQFYLMFIGLSSLLDQIESQKIHGCNMLEVLHKNAQCGIVSVEMAIKRIMYRCNKGLYKQLSSWLLFGYLNDPYHEFFIQPSVGDVVETKQSTVDDDELGLAGITGRQLKQMFSPPSVTSDELCPFTIRADLLPSYLSTRLAEKVLFIGESVQMFESGRTSVSINDDFLPSHEQQFARQLHSLSEEQEMNVTRLETLIDDIRKFVAERLWLFVVKESDLISELKQIKDFVLLGRGELFQAFIEQAHSLLKTAPASTTEHDVNLMLQQCARGLHLDDDVLIHKFQLTVQAPDKKTGGSAERSVETGWNCLGASYKTPWPLHIVVSQKILSMYNPVFLFLLKMKRAQQDLHRCWMRDKTTARRTAELSKAMNHMLFLVNNFQYYLQVDVIESLFSILIHDIEATLDIEEVKRAHERFVSSLLAQSFVHLKPVAYRLNEILDLCVSFTKLMFLPESTPDHHQQLHDVILNFQRESQLLFKILTQGHNLSCNPHLCQLILRLDYNRYYSSSGQLG